MKIKEISGEQFKKDALWMLPDHNKETEIYSKMGAINPSYETYDAIENSGSMFILAGFEKERIVGYSLNFMFPHLHYKDVMVCSNNLLYMVPEYRKGRNGLRLIKATEEEAKKRGSYIMNWSAKPGTPLDKIFQAKGYNLQDILYSKEL